VFTSKSQYGNKDKFVKFYLHEYNENGYLIPTLLLDTLFIPKTSKNNNCIIRCK
jgi:hypothetical protein